MNPLPAPPIPRLKILIGDDDSLIAGTLSFILNLSGFEAMDVHTGASIIAACVKWRPDLLLLDVNLQDMNGVDVALAVKAKLPGCRILFLSGAPMPDELVMRAAAAGYSFDSIVKPIYPGDLIAMLREKATAMPSDRVRKQPAAAWEYETVACHVA